MATFQFQSLPDFLKSKGVADISAKTPDEQAGLFNEYNAAYKTAVNEFAVGAAKDEATKAVKAYAENIESQFNVLKSAIETQGLAIQKMKDADIQPKAADTLESQLKAHADVLARMKTGDKSAKIYIKAAGNMSLANNVTGQIPQALRLAGYNDIAQREVRFLDLFQMGSISSNVVEWVYMANEDGTAGTTVEGALKNQIDFDWLLGTERVEKYTAFIKATDEMISDIPFMNVAIQTQLRRKLLQAVETASYSGNGTTPNLRGISTVATAWAAGTFATTVDNANLVDVLRVGINQIAIANQPRPNYILLHPSDWTALMLIKENATDRQYITVLQQIASTQSFEGIPIVLTTLVTAGTFLIGNSNLQYMLQKDAPSIEIGYDLDDFTKNFRTIRTEWRGVVYVQHNDRTAFVKGTIATAIAALETA